jgi:hypothetical protein
VRRADEQVDGLVPVLGVVAKPREGHRQSCREPLEAGPCAAIADDDEPACRQASAEKCLDQHFETFARSQAPNPADEEIPGGRARFTTQRRATHVGGPRVGHQRIGQLEHFAAVTRPQDFIDLPRRDAEQRIGREIMRTVQIDVQRGDVRHAASQLRDVTRASPQVSVDDVRPPLVEHGLQRRACTPVRRKFEDLHRRFEIVADARADRAAMVPTQDDRNVVVGGKCIAGFRGRTL